MAEGFTSGAAVRIDQEAGFEERVEFFGSHADKIIGTTYAPAGSVRAGLVLCPPICGDFLYNHRREIAIGRTLASFGVASQRLHYRGTGNSDGGSELTTLTTMVDDSWDAADRLVERFGPMSVAFLGTRMGALVAAAAGARNPGAPLVLVEPVDSPPRFFREGFRAQMTSDLKTQAVVRMTTKEMQAELQRVGRIDLLGHAVDRPLYDSVIDRTLRGEISPASGPVLLIQLSPGEVRPENRDLEQELVRRGTPVTIDVIGDPAAWWFEDSEERPNRSLLEAIRDWLLDVLEQRSDEGSER